MRNTNICMSAPPSGSLSLVEDGRFEALVALLRFGPAEGTSCSALCAWGIPDCQLQNAHEPTDMLCLRQPSVRRVPSPPGYFKVTAGISGQRCFVIRSLAQRAVGSRAWARLGSLVGSTRIVLLSRIIFMPHVFSRFIQFALRTLSRPCHVGLHFSIPLALQLMGVLAPCPNRQVRGKLLPHWELWL